MMTERTLNQRVSACLSDLLDLREQIHRTEMSETDSYRKRHLGMADGILTDHLLESMRELERLITKGTHG